MILAQSLFKAFDGMELLGGLSFEARAGESVAVVGPSGAGKSTLLRIIAGLSLPDRGEVQVAGRSLRRLTPRARTRMRAELMGFVFQGDNLLPHLTVLQNVSLPSAFRLQPIDPTTSKAALARVGLADQGNQLGGSLSGGEGQRVAVARVVAQRPAVLLCDEPTGSLDGPAAARVTELLLETVREMGCTLLVATHDVALASRCERRITLEPRASRKRGGGGDM